MAIFVSNLDDHVTSLQITHSNEATGGAAGFACSAGTPAETPGDSASMAESVTRHAQIPPVENSRFLLCGIDTLDLGLFVIWDENWKETVNHLEQQKIAAQGTTGIFDKSDIGRRFLHLPSAKPPNYKYQLHFPEYRIYISSSDKTSNTPNVYVSILSAVLWHEQLSVIFELLDIDIYSLGGTITQIQPSRCDLCADFKLETPPSLSFIQSHKVSRSKKYKAFFDGDNLESYYCGSPKAPAQLRIYDKGKEILVSNKQWFLNLWGIEDATNVWRVEFQLRRTFLHQYRVKTLVDLWTVIGSMWEYLTSEWFSLRIPDSDKTTRRPVHPWWEAVQDCRIRFGDLSGTTRTFTSDNVEPIQHTLSHIIGRLVTIAAQEGIEDRQEAIERLANLISEKTTDNSFKEECQKKAIKLGYRGNLGGSGNEE